MAKAATLERRTTGPVYCKHCHAKFNGNAGLSSYLRSAHGDFTRVTPAPRVYKKRKIKCPDCDYTCKTKLGLSIHIGKVHTGKPEEMPLATVEPPADAVPPAPVVAVEADGVDGQEPAELNADFLAQLVKGGTIDDALLKNADSPLAVPLVTSQLHRLFLRKELAEARLKNLRMKNILIELLAAPD